MHDIGAIVAMQIAPHENDPGARAFDIFRHCFDNGLLIRVTADIIALSPPLIISPEEIDRVTSMLGDGLHAAA